MRKLLTMILIAPLASLLVACGGGSDADDAATNEAAASQAHVTYLSAMRVNQFAFGGFTLVGRVLVDLDR